jgi:hypothetical protein
MQNEEYSSEDGYDCQGRSEARLCWQQLGMRWSIGANPCTQGVMGGGYVDMLLFPWV